jgi:hypothetical protein
MFLSLELEERFGLRLDVEKAVDGFNSELKGVTRRGKNNEVNERQQQCLCLNKTADQQPAILSKDKGYQATKGDSGPFKDTREEKCPSTPFPYATRTCR